MEHSWTLGDFVASVKGETRNVFLQRHPYPFLLRQNEPGAAIPNTTSTTAFNTMALDPQKLRARARELLSLRLFPVVKRAGGNAFGLMVTLGRAPNNDIVFADQQVSKFHASFAKNAQGQWTITDSSSQGTWIDLRRLEPRTAVPLRSDANIDLAHAVLLTFLTAERVWDEVENVRRRDTMSS